MCTVNITSVIGVLSGGSLTAINVEGTATDCEEIRIGLECSGGGDIQTTTVDAAGNWSFSFTTVPCQCGEQINIAAFCTTDPDCLDEFNDPLPCEGQPPDDCCPTINSATAEVGECSDSGEVTVTFDGVITVPAGCTPTIVEWDFGDGTSSAASTFTTAGTITLPTVMHVYTGDGSSVAAQLRVVFPLGCAEQVVNLDLPECEVGLLCPEFEQTEGVGNCDDEGNRSVSVTVTLTLPGETIEAELKQGGAVLTSGTGADTLVLSHSDNYPGGSSQNFTVSINSPTGCGDLPFAVDVPDCGPDDDGDDSTSFCGGPWWCCLLWGLFLVSLVTTIVSLGVALCGGTTAWVVFAIALAATIVTGILLMILCDVDLCLFLLTIAGAGFAGFAIACGTTLAPCTSWLCAKTLIPGTSVKAANLLIIDVIFTILVLIICAIISASEDD